MATVSNLNAEASTPGSATSVGPIHSTFVGNTAAVLSGQAANVFVAFLTEISIARLLGPGPRGQISLCLMALWFAVLFGGLGAEVPIVLWSSDRSRKLSEWLSTVLLWGLLGSLASAALWWLVYSRWHSSVLRGVTPDLAFLVLLSIPLGVLFNFLISFFNGTERFRERAAVGFLESVASLVGLLILAWFLGRDATAALRGNLLGLAVGVALAACLLRRNFRLANWALPRIDHHNWSGLMVGFYGNFGNIAAFFNYRLDVFIVNYFLSTTQVGVYAVGVAVSESLWQIPQAAATALFPRTARTLQEGAAAFTCQILRQVCLISVATAALLALVSPVAIPLFFGARFTSSVPVIWWILPGTVALALGKVAASDLAGRRKTYYTSIFGILSLVITALLDVLLIPRMGIAGAALASSLAYSLYGGLLLAALRHELQVSWRTILIPSRAEFLRYRQSFGALTQRITRNAS